MCASTSPIIKLFAAVTASLVNCFAFFDGRHVVCRKDASSQPLKEDLEFSDVETESCPVMFSAKEIETMLDPKALAGRLAYIERENPSDIATVFHNSSSRASAQASPGRYIKTQAEVRVMTFLLRLIQYQGLEEGAQRGVREICEVQSSQG